MKLITSGHLRTVTAILSGVVVAALLGNLFLDKTVVSALTTHESNVEMAEVYLSTTSIPVRVSGVVSAADSTIIYAETAGVVTDLLAREGATVVSGKILIKQSSPVLDAERQLVAAQSELSKLQQAASVESAVGGADIAQLRSYSAAEIAALRSIGNDNRTKEVSNSLLSTIESSSLVSIEAIDYINNNRSLFSAEGLKFYNEVVSELYGRVPNYFRGNVTYPTRSAEDVLSLIEEIKSNPDSSPMALQEVSVLLQGQLNAVSYLFSTAESDVFDRGTSYVTEDMQSEYLTDRASVLSALQSLQTAQSNWQRVIDGVLEESVSLNTDVSVTEVDKQLADIQAEYTRQIAAQSVAVNLASEGVVAAQQSLGQLRAPFAGVVSHVHVKKGEYVMPGTPLLTLVGSGARELEVSVPAYLLPKVSAGQVFMVGNEVLGFVERFSSVSEGGSGKVVITLVGEAVLPVGGSVIGDLIIDASESIYSVPRAYVHFASDGPFLQYRSGKVSPIEIVYDTGNTFFLKVSETSDEPLVPANSIAL